MALIVGGFEQYLGAGKMVPLEKTISLSEGVCVTGEADAKCQTTAPDK